MSPATKTKKDKAFSSAGWGTLYRVLLLRDATPHELNRHQQTPGVGSVLDLELRDRPSRVGAGLHGFQPAPGMGRVPDDRRHLRGAGLPSHAGAICKAISAIASA